MFVSLFKGNKHSTKVLSHGAKLKKAVVHVTEETDTTDKSHPGVSYSAASLKSAYMVN